MKDKDIPKFEPFNILNMNVFEPTRYVLSPVHKMKKYTQPQIELLLYENHYCSITELHMLTDKDPHSMS